MRNAAEFVQAEIGERVGARRATSSDTTTGRFSDFAMSAVRATSFTARPSTPNLSRSGVPALPNTTSPKCTPMPNSMARALPLPSRFSAASRSRAPAAA